MTCISTCCVCPVSCLFVFVFIGVRIRQEEKHAKMKGVVKRILSFFIFRRILRFVFSALETYFLVILHLSSSLVHFVRLK